MKKKGILFKIIPLATLLFSLTAQTIVFAGGYGGFEPYEGYSYGGAAYGLLPAPNGFLPEDIIDGDLLGIGAFKNPQDFFYQKDSKLLYLLDSGNNRIVVFDSDLEFVKIIENFTYEDENYDLSVSAKSVFVHKNGEIYVTDTGNFQIIVMNDNGVINRVYEKPDTPFMSDNIAFDPIQVAVDSSGMIYVLAKSVSNGLITLDQAGNFLGFYGTAEVPKTWEYYFEMFMRKIFKNSTITLGTSFVPKAYGNFHLREDDFIYAVISVPVKVEASEKQLYKLNPKGVDVMTGAYDYVYYGLPGFSFLGDVVTGEDEIFYILDSGFGKVYLCIEGYWEMLMPGSYGDTFGTFKSPIAVEVIGERILVLDSDKASVTVFDPTEYGKLVIEALKHENIGDFRSAAEKWNELFKMNATLRKAYEGLGMAELDEENYEEAMKYFKLAWRTDGFGEAKELNRQKLLSRYMGPGIVVIVIVYIVFKLKKFIAKPFAKLLKRDETGGEK